MLRTAPLSARSLSQEQSLAHIAIYAASPLTRAHFAAGQAMARSGELVRRRWDGEQDKADAEQLRRVRQDALTAGRRTRARAAEDRLAATLRTGGFTDLGHALRTVCTEQQNSIEDTARILGVGRNRLRQLLAEHGIRIRPTGQNTTAGRYARIQLNDRKAAERVGAHDIGAWLCDQAASGAALRELAAATGRSIPWVASRIRPP
ncbi:hypothetical protein [Streptomyces sp. IBSBF 2435]|uniref:hypothetical protein n=1 Tax=Streptomyces sp. IBSBF 2435 TaxID=2903531 RepID=UPI002FDC60C3